MAKRVTLSFLVDDDEDVEEWRDEFHDDVQNLIVDATGAATTIDIDVQEGVPG
jgi:hypothetical protein